MDAVPGRKRLIIIIRSAVRRSPVCLTLILSATQKRCLLRKYQSTESAEHSSSYHSTRSSHFGLFWLTNRTAGPKGNWNPHQKQSLPLLHRWRKCAWHYDEVDRTRPLIGQGWRITRHCRIADVNDSIFSNIGQCGEGRPCFQSALRFHDLLGEASQALGVQ